MKKKLSRIRRALRTKFVIKQSKKPRLVVFRSNQHIYAQIVQAHPQGDQVLAMCSSVDAELRANLKGSKLERAKQVGALLAKRAKGKGVEVIAFDRAGYKYHGRVRALADAVREEGVNF
ncbi:MAG: 50S ribosomal protein L18 [Legionellaceae bacterium]|nr:50S ribosomal protein L18 [Legionellaceae bacterium]